MKKILHLRTDEVVASSRVQRAEILYENFSPLVYMQRPLAPEASIKDHKNQEGNIVQAGVIGGAVIGGLETALGYGVAFAVEFLHKV